MVKTVGSRTFYNKNDSPFSDFPMFDRQLVSVFRISTNYCLQGAGAGGGGVSGQRRQPPPTRCKRTCKVSTVEQAVTLRCFPATSNFDTSNYTKQTWKLYQVLLDN